MKAFEGLVFGILILNCVLNVDAKKSFKNYKLVRLFPKLDEKFSMLNDLESIDSNFDIWRIGKDKTLDVLLPPFLIHTYQTFFKANSIKYEILVDDVQKQIDEEEHSMLKNSRNSNIIFKYARYSEIMNFIQDIERDNRDIVTTYDAGKTYENRTLKVVVLKTPTASRSLWFDCGIHAREWVSPSTCVYMINQLIKEYRDKDPDTLKIFNKYEIHIMPLVNPDGYEYSHTTYRLWRKNRNPNSGSTCIGTDLNRNYGFRWLTGGSSTSPCSDTFAGRVQNSELETQAIISAINKKINQWDSFISLHSYGNWWLLPWGHSKTEKTDDYDDLYNKGIIGANAIKQVHGQIYTVGSSSSLLYINTGGSADWAKGVANIKYTYVLELRPGSNDKDASYGFTLPEDRMPQVAPETYAGIKAFVKSIL